MPLGLGKSRLGILRSAPDFRLLFAATLASSMGTWLAFVALVVDVYDRTESAAWVSALMVVEFAPLVAVGFVAGPLIDRLPRRGVVASADAVRAGLFCIIPFATGALQIVMIALAVGVATSCFRPAVYAGLPNLVSDRQLPHANGLLQSAENVTLAVGPLAGGLLVAAVGPHPAYWFNAATFAVSGLLILRIRHSFEQGSAGSEGHWRDVVAGLALLRSSRPLLTVVVVWSVVMLGSAGVSVAEIVLAKRVFGAGDAGYGLMLAAMGVGLVLGGLWAGDWVESHGVRVPYVTATAVMAAGIGAAAAAPGVWVAGALLVPAGAGNGIALVCNAVLIQRGVADRVRGRAFTLAMGASSAALGLGMIGAGPLTDSIGARQVWGLSAGVIGLGGLAGAVLTRGLRLGPESAAPEATVQEVGV